MAILLIKLLSSTLDLSFLTLAQTLLLESQHFKAKLIICENSDIRYSEKKLLNTVNANWIIKNIVA